ncbi:hypothetical protein HYW84_00885 [Candidatus Peregrinibacteria bacterium]|nr:hypothetical protein [Candidatus Peregrinibacteria bacterium]
MKRFLFSIGASLLAVFVTACIATPPASAPIQPVESPAAAGGGELSSAKRSASIEGVLQKAGVDIYMQGTHRLLMDDGTFLLLQSSTVRLDDFLDSRVIVTGGVQPAVGAGGMIMNVEMLVPAESLPPEILIEGAQFGRSSSAFSSAHSVTQADDAAASSVAPISARSWSSSPYLSSAAATPPTAPFVPAAPIAPEAVSSSSASASSLASSSADASAIIKTMAKAAVGQETFAVQYCNGHIGFCVPLHKYWFYKSFGSAVSPYLWHVEISSRPVEEAGQGVLVVNLVSGSLTGPEGAAVAQGDFVVASRQWTGGRHFEISGPAELKAAVEFMANGVEVYSVE